MLRVCRFVIGLIALAVLLQHGLPGQAGAAAIAAERHLAFSSIAAPASDDPFAPCADHAGMPSACCIGSLCAAAALAPVSAVSLNAPSASGYAMPAGELHGGIARIPGLHPPRRVA
jgi:hypothetical protein